MSNTYVIKVRKSAITVKQQEHVHHNHHIADMRKQVQADSAKAGVSQYEALRNYDVHLYEIGDFSFFHCLNKAVMLETVKYLSAESVYHEVLL